MNEDTNTYKTRMLFEFRDLIIKIARLDAFLDLNKSMDEKDYKLLCEQKDAMKRYEEVLGLRIEKLLNS